MVWAVARPGVAEEIAQFTVDETGNSTMTGKKYPLKRKRSVWPVNVSTFSSEHCAAFPIKLIIPCVLAGSKEHGTVLDPFAGTSTTGMAAYEHNRKFIGIELSEEYCAISKKRLQETNQKLLF